MGSESLTYHERKALGFGTVSERLGKDSQGNYYDCCLTLQPAKDPVVTPEGYLYSREAILENLLAQKKAIKRKVAEWQAYQLEEAQKATEKATVEREAKLIAFDRQNHMGISERTAKHIEAAIQEEAAMQHEVQGAKGVVAIKDNADRMKEMKAFWVPGKAPGVREVMHKPDEDTRCPASGSKMRLKDLSAVRFTPVPEGEAGRHMDPVTKDVFTNSSRLMVLRPTGDVVLQETWEKCIKPEGSFKGVRVREKDAVRLRTGGTGFAAHDSAKVLAKKHFALGPGSGKADLRGQHQGARSLGGLVFMN